MDAPEDLRQWILAQSRVGGVPERTLRYLKRQLKKGQPPKASPTLKKLWERYYGRNYTGGGLPLVVEAEVIGLDG